MLPACAIYAVFFKSVSCRSENCNKNKNCFEFALTNLKTVSNPKVKTKRENMSNRKLLQKMETVFIFAVTNLKNVSNPKAKKQNVKMCPTENCN